MFEFQWDEVGEKPFRASWADEADHFDELLALVDSGACRFTEPIRAEIEARPLAGLVEVAGQISTAVVLACSRCLEEYRLTIEAPFRLTFTRDAAETVAEEDPDADDEAGIELDVEALGLVYVEGEVVRLRSLVAEQVILEIPARGVCGEGCKGLCPHCGQNLNDTECGCKEPVFDTRFAALAKLNIDSKPEK
ncbi:MAG: DUF177 domain-containing protein [Deltaproteobacteria bacterium]|nr:MAG: DUF177 domain-containing protein [Deltaproteobacteria bacterium]